jgi:hypothetical protein
MLHPCKRGMKRAPDTGLWRASSRRPTADEAPPWSAGLASIGVQAVHGGRWMNVYHHKISNQIRITVSGSMASAE